MSVQIAVPPGKLHEFFTLHIRHCTYCADTSDMRNENRLMELIPLSFIVFAFSKSAAIMLLLLTDT